jgi:transcriptional regulator GlxA family with amidase domain
MIRVSIIVPGGCSVESSITKLLNIFEFANSCLNQQGKQALFAAYLVGAAPRVPLYGNSAWVRPHLTLDDRGENNVVIVPALAGEIASGLKNNRVFLPWLVEQYQHGAEIAGLCTGAFLLAETGLVNAEKCDKAWYVCAGFRKEFLQVGGVAEKLLPDEKLIFTAMGAYTFLHRLLQNSADALLAAACADVFEARFNRECQSIFCVAYQAGRTARSDETSLSSVPFRDRFHLTADPPKAVGGVENLNMTYEPNVLRRSHLSDLPNDSSITKNSVVLKRLFRRAVGK